MDKGPNDDVSIGSDEEISDGIQHQLEAHIAGLKSVEINKDGEVDNSTNSDIVNDRSNNSADKGIPSSDTFQQFKI